MSDEDTCRAEKPGDRYAARCHRDPGHEGEHRAFAVGAMRPVTWSPLQKHSPAELCDCAPPATFEGRPFHCAIL